MLRLVGHGANDGEIIHEGVAASVAMALAANDCAELLERREATARVVARAFDRTFDQLFDPELRQ